MDHKYIWIPLVVGAAAFTSCKDKATTSSPDSEGKSIVESVTEAVKDVTSAALSAEQRAEKMGFAAQLPKNISTYSSFYNGRKAFDKFLTTDLGSFILARMADEGMELEGLFADPSVSAQIAMYSEEYFTAYGEGAGAEVEEAVNFYEKILFYTGSFGVHAADAMLKDVENFNERALMGSLMPLSNGPLKDAPRDVIKLMANFDMPALYQGMKVSDPEQRGLVMENMTEGFAMFAMMGDAVEEIVVKRGEIEFAGYKISGDKLAAKITDEQVVQMQEVIEKQDIDDFKATLVKKNLVLVTGVVGDYILMFIGENEDDLVLVDNVKDSFCSRDELNDIDPYFEKDILSISFADGGVAQNMSSLEVIGFRMVNALMEGFTTGFAKAESMGDLRDVEALLESLVAQGKSLAGMFSSTDQTVVSYLDNGYKVESFGGSNVPSIDFSSKHKLSPLGTCDSLLLYADWTGNAEYDAKVNEYVDTLFETTYILASKVAGLGIDSSEFKQFQQGLGMFDQMARKDIVELSDALRGDMAEGLGSEAALVIDINGKLPQVPGVPAKVLEEGKMPRIAFVSTVDDRAKLQSAWKRTNASIENILKTATALSGKKIPMQVPMSSEKDGLKTWFVPIPFQNDDFVPSVSVSDELFFLSTSKSYSEGLTDLYKAGGGESRKGAWIQVDFKVLNQYADDLFTLVENNAEELIPNEMNREDFNANKVMIKDALNAFKGLEKMTSHVRQEGGRTRVSIDFQAK